MMLLPRSLLQTKSDLDEKHPGSGFRESIFCVSLNINLFLYFFSGILTSNTLNFIFELLFERCYTSVVEHTNTDWI